MALVEASKLQYDIQTTTTDGRQFESVHGPVRGETEASERIHGAKQQQLLEVSGGADSTETPKQQDEPGKRQRTQFDH